MAKRGKRPRTAIQRRRLAYLLLSPALLVMLLVYVIPGIQLVYISLLNLTTETLLQYLGAPFAGFRHYAQIINGLLGNETSLIQGLFLAIRNTFWYTLWVELGTLGLGLAAALLLNRRFWWRGLALTVLILPWVVPSAATGIMWRSIWRQEGGLANLILYNWLQVTDEPISWLMLEHSRTALIVPSIWRWLPFTSVVFLARLRTIPGEIYEAASLDGANGRQKLRFLTWPFLLPAFLATALFGIIYNFFGFNGYNIGQMLFWSDNFGRYADLLVPSLVRQTFTNNLYGFGAATTVLMTSIALGLLVLGYRIYTAGSERVA